MQWTVEQLIQLIYSWQDMSISLDRMNEIHLEAKRRITIGHGILIQKNLQKDILLP